MIFPPNRIGASHLFPSSRWIILIYLSCSLDRRWSSLYLWNNIFHRNISCLFHHRILSGLLLPLLLLFRCRCSLFLWCSSLLFRIRSSSRLLCNFSCRFFFGSSRLLFGWCLFFLCCGGSCLFLCWSILLLGCLLFRLWCSLGLLGSDDKLSFSWVLVIVTCHRENNMCGESFLTSSIELC